MIKKITGILMILSCTISYAQENFSLYFFFREDDGKGDYLQVENFLDKDSIYGISKTYHIVDMKLKDEKIYFKNKMDAQSRMAIFNLIKRDIKSEKISLFDAKNPLFLTWFENEKKKYKSYFTFKVNGFEYYNFDKFVNQGYNINRAELVDLKIALSKWAAPRFYERYMQKEKEAKEEAELAKAMEAKKTKMVVSTNAKNFKRIFISQLSKLQNNENVETIVIIDNKGNRTIKTISGKVTTTKTDVICNFENFKNSLSELVVKEKPTLQWAVSIREVPDVGKTDGYIEIAMVENAQDYPNDKVAFVFSWMINTTNKENKKTDYKTKISESSIKFLEGVLYK